MSKLQYGGTANVDANPTHGKPQNKGTTVEQWNFRKVGDHTIMIQHTTGSFNWFKALQKYMPMAQTLDVENRRGWRFYSM